MRRTVRLLGLLVMLASCGRASSAASPTPETGVLSGVVVAHTSQGTERTPLGDATVVVYREAVQAGGVAIQNQPNPVTTTTTNAEGVFRFVGLSSGSWFLLVQNEAGGGTWVGFDAAKGAVVTLVVCTDCPVPA